MISLAPDRTSLYTGSISKKIDQVAINSYGHSGFELMTRAGESVFAQLSQYSESTRKMLVLCGSGNNAGDGYVVARCALQEKWDVQVVAVKEPKSKDAQATRSEFLELGGEIIDNIPSGCSKDLVIIDALLGVCLQGSISGVYAKWIDRANQMAGFKVALDVPSGLDADTGNVYLPAFEADLTVSFIVPKIGLYTGPGRTIAGVVLNDDLGIDVEILSQFTPPTRLLSSPTFNARQKDTHKGSYGSVCVAGGESGMLGAVLLAGRAALRCGAGKVTVMSTDEHLDLPALTTPELMSSVFENRSDQLLTARAFAVGPGLGTSAWGQQVFDSCLTLDQSMVLDADALNLLATMKDDDLTPRPNWVLTPHPGEAASLLSISSAEVQADRVSAAKQIASKWQCVCVLKGAGTLISAPDGAVTVCDLGNPGMASAGMGDVLSGMVLAFMGQGLDPLDAAKTAVWLHAKAGDQVRSRTNELSLIASDIIEELPSVIRMQYAD